MKKTFLLLGLILGLASCTHGWKQIKQDQYHIYPDKTYKLYAMQVQSIDNYGGDLGGTITLAYKDRTWTFSYDGDAEYDFLDNINVKFKGTKIISMGRPWLTTRFFFMFTHLLGLPYFFAKWVDMILILFDLFPAMGTAR